MAGSPSGALGLAAACLHHLGEDTFINNENRTDTEITRTEGGDGAELSQHGASYSWRKSWHLVTVDLANPAGLSAEGAERILAPVSSELREYPATESWALGTKISFLIHLQSLPAAQYIRRGNGGSHKPTSSASLYVYLFFQ